MVLLFDHQTFSLQNYGGISRYFRELIVGINETNPDHEVKLAIKYSNNAYLSHEWAKPFLSGIEFPKKNNLLYLINKQISINKLRTGAFDILHPTYYDPYFLNYIKHKPYVITVLDMIHEKFSSVYKELAHDKKMVHWKELVIKNATKIIAISENTKRDVIDIYGIDPDKIQVIYLANSLLVNNTEQANLSLVTERPYLLFVGNRGFYKNFNQLITAIAPLLKRHDINLICAGGGAFTKTELEQITDLDVTSRVQQQPINDTKLVGLYKHAIAFIFPSLYEGFGIPVLEAFACDCPNVLTNSSSLPEVGGDAALYMDSRDNDSINDAIEKILTDSSLRASLIAKGKERLKQFSWTRTVEETIGLYQHV
ncbi:glycosyltransferase family 4 protein [Spirosoma fluminis]